jgi:cytosine/adenosine deaminase-related metal-dependent hydrolase
MSVGGTAAQTTIKHLDNPGGLARTPNEAIELLKGEGIHAPEGAVFKIVPHEQLTNTKGALAEYGLQRGAHGDRIFDFEEYFKVSGNEPIPILLSEKLLKSDEALLAHAIHEAYEVERLQKLFQAADYQLPARTIAQQVTALERKNFHYMAWEEADKFIKERRAKLAGK